MSTKQNGDIAEQRVVYELLKRGYDVLRPVGDRLRYDVAIDRGGRLIRLQVKLAWKAETWGTYCVDIRRHQTNRVNYKFTRYQPNDFDILVAWIRELDVFFLLPSEVACSFASSISLPTQDGARTRSRTTPWREAWHVLENLRGVEQ